MQSSQIHLTRVKLIDQNGHTKILHDQQIYKILFLKTNIFLKATCHKFDRNCLVLNIQKI